MSNMQILDRLQDSGAAVRIIEKMQPTIKDVVEYYQPEFEQVGNDVLRSQEKINESMNRITSMFGGEKYVK